MPLEPTAEIRTRTRGEQRLGYSKEFRQMLREHPGIIGAALKLSQQAEGAYFPGDMQLGGVGLRWSPDVNNWQEISYFGKTHEEPQPLTYGSRGIFFKPDSVHVDPGSGLEITVLGKARRELGGGFFGDPTRLDISTYFKMKLGDQTFFIKKSTSTVNPAYDEFSNSIKMKNTLSDIDNLSVVDAQLGYHDSKQSWFVSSWKDLEGSGFFSADTFIAGRWDDYGKQVDKKFLRGRGELTTKLEEMEFLIKEKGEEVGIELHDVNRNLFFNPETGKFFLIDITAPTSEPINPLRRRRTY